MAPLLLALVNDYEVVVRGLEAMLRSYGPRVRVVELDAQVDVASRVDIALYDTFGQTQGDGTDITKVVRNPRVDRVVAYSWNIDPELVRRTLAQGVSGYLSKSLPAAELVLRLERVASGELVVPHDTDLVSTVHGDWPGREEGLTAREAEVLSLITQGLSNDEIAQRTALSINSIKTFIRSAYRRIGVTSRSNAILWGIDHGLRPDVARLRPEPPQGATTAPPPPRSPARR